MAVMAICPVHGRCGHTGLNSDYCLKCKKYHYEIEREINLKEEK